MASYAEMQQAAASLINQSPPSVLGVKAAWVKRQKELCQGQVDAHLNWKNNQGFSGRKWKRG
jgi:hypothetical protein